MTIDEAIAFERQQAKDKRNEHYTFGIQKSKEAAEEHEQLADWLEELKALREEKSEFQIMAKDNYKMGMESGYNKAIDDCKELTFREVVYCDSLNDRTEFRELAEQLKERNNE